ncbi:mechanosensitive ion channel family protein [Microbacterium sp. JZ70]|uniref:mechanosensitive ion channel family protein n=1 Tax=Microbacterium sp. JZ37 TaxID=2654193 RepID=UPI002B470FA9|nr:mechanosensitive ion channel domain-containing protein [Microbacterium sp. JZ37]WRH17298.1 mechanosensitive ion channel [Microbacterium sp. JZ37]
MMKTETADPTDLSWWQDRLVELGQFGWLLVQAAIAVLACVIVAWILRLVIRRVVKRIVEGAKSKAKVDDTRALERSPLASVRVVQRTRTLGSILTNVVNIAMVVVALVLVASILVPDVLASLSLLTAAVGAGLGFGAQNIVKDVLNGIFIVAEDQIGIGDVVDLGLATGVVEFVSVRITHVRDVNGVLWYVRNGEITRIGNMTQGWSRVVLDLTLPKDIVIEDVESLIADTSLGLAHDPRWRSRVIGEPEVWGLESLEGETLVVRLVIKAKPTAKDDVARELRERLRAVLLTEGIDVTGIARATLEGAEGALRVRGANPPTITSELPERPTWRPRPRDEKSPTAPAGRQEGGQDEEEGADT